jgi:hypothetical protein
LNTSSWGFFSTATLLELVKLRKPKNLALGGLFYNAAGAWFYSRVPSSASVLSLFRAQVAEVGSLLSPNPTLFTWPAYLHQLEPHSQVCLLSTKPVTGPLGKFQISRSPGSSSLLLTPLFLDE